MRALSLTQPWASLVAAGFKRIETRDWMTRYRGPIAIHAAKGFPDGARELCYSEPFKTALMQAGYETDRQLPLQAVLCTTRLTDCLRVGGGLFMQLLPPEQSLERAFGDYSYGRFMWLFDQISTLQRPFPVRGYPGLWDWALPSPEFLQSHVVAPRG